eukprot:2870982-Rhodomonas_salina.1
MRVSHDARACALALARQPLARAVRDYRRHGQQQHASDVDQQQHASDDQQQHASDDVSVQQHASDVSVQQHERVLRSVNTR